MFKPNRDKKFKLKPNGARHFKTFRLIKLRFHGLVLVFKLGQNSKFHILASKLKDFSYNIKIKVLIYKRHVRSLSGEDKSPEGMINNDQKQLDLMAMSIIKLHLVDNI